jgi:hypothetical protein
MKNNFIEMIKGLLDGVYITFAVIVTLTVIYNIDYFIQEDVSGDVIVNETIVSSVKSKVNSEIEVVNETDIEKLIANNIVKFTKCEPYKIQVGDTLFGLQKRLFLNETLKDEHGNQLNQKIKVNQVIYHCFD